jgi:hypothetical protein
MKKKTPSKKKAASKVVDIKTRKPVAKKKATRKKTKAKATPRRNNGNKITVAQKNRFINTMELTGSATQAAEDAGRHLTSFYHIRKNDLKFEKRWDEAKAQFVHGPLESKLIDMALNGVMEVEEKRGVGANGIEFIIHKKGTKRHFPTLLLRILERRHPDYKPPNEFTLHTDPDDGLQSVSDVDMSKLTPAEKLQLGILLQKAAEDETKNSGQ